jgi:hypothetical protein
MREASRTAPTAMMKMVQASMATPYHLGGTLEVAAAALKLPAPLLEARLPRVFSNWETRPFHQRKKVWAQWKHVLSQCCIEGILLPDRQGPTNGDQAAR